MALDEHDKKSIERLSFPDLDDPEFERVAKKCFLKYNNRMKGYKCQSYDNKTNWRGMGGLCQREFCPKIKTKGR